jgi:hypothetical protein
MVTVNEFSLKNSGFKMRFRRAFQLRDFGVNLREFLKLFLTIRIGVTERQAEFYQLPTKAGNVEEKWFALISYHIVGGCLNQLTLTGRLKLTT